MPVSLKPPDFGMFARRLHGVGCFHPIGFKDVFADVCVKLGKMVIFH